MRDRRLPAGMADGGCSTNTPTTPGSSWPRTIDARTARPRNESRGTVVRSRPLLRALPAGGSSSRSNPSTSPPASVSCAPRDRTAAAAWPIQGRGRPRRIEHDRRHPQERGDERHDQDGLDDARQSREVPPRDCAQCLAHGDHGGEAEQPGGPTATTKWMGISSRPASKPIGSLATISGGWRTVGMAVTASAKPAANNATARSLARTITPCATGNGPRIDESRDPATARPRRRRPPAPSRSSSRSGRTSDRLPPASPSAPATEAA